MCSSDLAAVQGLDAAAARAVAIADVEARQLGHDRVGTEHLLLGLLTNDSGTSLMLTNAGVTVAAARNKVNEAVGISREDTDVRTGPLPRTPRATRALGRSARFAHTRGSEVVTSDHVLMGVLDVEGIAGQVLRGLGVDVESLRGSLDALVDVSPSERSPESRQRDTGGFRPATCPSCNAVLDHELVYRVVRANGEHEDTRDALIFLCGVCGRVVGAGPT